KYYFVVSAQNNVGEGNNSTEIFSTPFLPAPLPPTTLGATAGDGNVALQWNSVSGATSYNVKYSTTPGGPYTTVLNGITATNETLTGLTTATNYYFVVSAQNSGGEGNNSTQVSGTPSTTPTSTTTLDFSGGFGSAAGLLTFNGSAKLASGALSLID